MAVEIVMTGNGPGELAGWVRPVARAARELARERNINLRLTMFLTPSQFASGMEPDVLRRWNLFEQILTPADAVKLALGFGHARSDRDGAVVHLGGDLWFSIRLARRFGLPVCAVAETTLIARRHRPFSQIFATSDEIAEQLAHAGIPPEKVLMTGDPRVDAVETPVLTSHGSRITGHEYIVSFMPGSRDYLFSALVPYFLSVANDLRREAPVRFQVAVSPFLPRDVVDRVRQEAQGTCPDLDVTWVDEPWPALSQSDFVLTVPGTNTVELAAAGVPFAAIAPEAMLDHLRLEGLANWIAQFPVIGRAFKRAAALRVLTAQRFIALPNQRAGRVVAPEWVGTWPEDAFISYLRRMLEDRERRAEMSAQLRALYAGERGASRVIAERSLALAGGVG